MYMQLCSINLFSTYVYSGALPYVFSTYTYMVVFHHNLAIYKLVYVLYDLAFLQLYMLVIHYDLLEHK